jgi:carbamoyltransferase
VAHTPNIALGVRPTLDLAESTRLIASGNVIVGVSGARRNAAAAIAAQGQLLGVCEQERLTRIRGFALQPGELPTDAVDAVLRMTNRERGDVTAYVTGEDGVSLPAGLPRVRLDHHFSHAATAFLTSPFERAAILVCDQSASPEVSVWVGSGVDIASQHWPWRGPGFASLFTEASRLFGFDRREEHRLEALARLDSASDVDLRRLFQYADGTLRVDPDWTRVASDLLYSEGTPWSVARGAQVAGALQSALCEALFALVADVRRIVGATHLCVGGGLFFNTFFNTQIASSRIFDDVFVPPNPGNAGVAAGAALAVNCRSGHRNPGRVSPALGPEYGLDEIKATLDNCKLSYECLSYGELIDICVDTLAGGRLVGWFQGRMEWGPRALGQRSILASPFSQYVLDNLNVYLKRRERYRAYGLSVLEEDCARYFNGPARSSWMEYEYRLKDVERFRYVLPRVTSRLRVQTIDADGSLFRDLHSAFAAATGAGVLVNTSFNGFSEPIVCSPRDAVRVFYGTGLDVLVLGRFLVRK